MIKTELIWYTPGEKTPEGGDSLLLFVKNRCEWLDGYYDGTFEFYNMDNRQWNPVHVDNVEFWAVAPLKEQVVEAKQHEDKTSINSMFGACGGNGIGLIDD